jgi:CCR4-NOT complex subunit CAF16
MLLGKTVAPPLPWPPAENDTGPKELFKLALGWLKEDKVVRKEREKVTGRIRGPKAEVSLPFSFHNPCFSSLRLPAPLRPFTA